MLEPSLKNGSKRSLPHSDKDSPQNQHKGTKRIRRSSTNIKENPKEHTPVSLLKPKPDPNTGTPASERVVSTDQIRLKAREMIKKGLNSKCKF